MVYKVFLETKMNTKPDWTKAVVGNKNYSVIETPMESPVLVGMLQNSSDSVVLRAKKNNKIWQLNLESTNETSQQNHTAVDANAIVLQGRCGKKKVTYTVKPLKTLQPAMHE